MCQNVNQPIKSNNLSPAVFVDLKTPRPFVEDLSQFGDDGSSAEVAKEDHIYMDAMGFGMGCSCLQMTFQACNINEARVLYDHLTPICPVMVRCCCYACAVIQYCTLNMRFDRAQLRLRTGKISLLVFECITFNTDICDRGMTCS